VQLPGRLGNDTYLRLLSDAGLAYACADLRLNTEEGIEDSGITLVHTGELSILQRHICSPGEPEDCAGNKDYPWA
jgi:hypothetical protein